MMYQRSTSTSTGEGARLLRRLDCLNEHIQAADAHIIKQLEVISDLEDSGYGAAQAILNALDGARARAVAERDRIRALLDQV